MPKQNKPPDQLSPDHILRRMLNTPPIKRPPKAKPQPQDGSKTEKPPAKSTGG